MQNAFVGQYVEQFDTNIGGRRIITKVCFDLVLFIIISISIIIIIVSSSFFVIIIVITVVHGIAHAVVAVTIISIYRYHAYTVKLQVSLSLYHFGHHYLYHNILIVNGIAMFVGDVIVNIIVTFFCVAFFHRYRYLHRSSLSLSFSTTAWLIFLYDYHQRYRHCLRHRCRYCCRCRFLYRYRYCCRCCYTAVVVDTVSVFILIMIPLQYYHHLPCHRPHHRRWCCRTFICGYKWSKRQ